MYYFKSVKRLYSVLVMRETFISELILKKYQATKVVLKSEVSKLVLCPLREVSTKTLIKTKAVSGMSSQNFCKNIY